jgi:MFS family permease
MQTSIPTDSHETAPAKAPMFPANHRLLFALIIVLFFLWGMSNNLTDILVQQFKKSFELSQLGAQLVQTANFLGYFCMAIPAAILMRRWGYKAGMIVGLCTSIYLFSLRSSLSAAAHRFLKPPAIPSWRNSVPRRLLSAVSTSRSPSIRQAPLSASSLVRVSSSQASS